MDSRIGLDYIVENAEYTTKLGAGKQLILYYLMYTDSGGWNQWTILKMFVVFILLLESQNETNLLVSVMLMS